MAGYVCDELRFGGEWKKDSILGNSTFIASVSYIFKPMGSIASGWITEPIGRKKSMFFVNTPHLVAWTLLYYSSTFPEVMFATVLLGIGVGLMEAPIITYVGEIW